MRTPCRAIALAVSLVWSAAARDAAAGGEIPEPVLQAAAGVVKVFAGARGREAQAGGSGFIADGLGYAVTNSHVLGPDAGPGTIVRVEFPSGEAVKGVLVADQPARDLALLRLEPPLPRRWPALEARAVETEEGMPVFELGYPLGRGLSVERGVVTRSREFIDPLRLHRRLGSAVEYLRTDARTLPGNSGGPLLDSEGRVAGVVKGEAGGRGWAISAKDVAAFLEEFLPAR